MSVTIPSTDLTDYLFIDLSRTFKNFCLIYIQILYIVIYCVYFSCLLVPSLLNYVSFIVVKHFHLSLMQTKKFYSLVDFYLSMHILFSSLSLWPLQFFFTFYWKKNSLTSTKLFKTFFTRKYFSHMNTYGVDAI